MIQPRRKELDAPPGWPYEADPDLAGLDDIALIWELKRRGRAVVYLGPNPSTGHMIG
jgi:hypothetical protein